MALTRAEAQKLIDAQREAIREHIQKYYSYQVDYEKEFALKTIRRCQENIKDYKRRCNVSISDGYEDFWSP